MIAKLPKEEADRRNEAIRRSQAEVMRRAALHYMTTFVKEYGGDLESLLRLIPWTDNEKQLIARHFKYGR